MYQTVLLFVIIIVNSLLGLLVYLKNPKSVTNRLFLMLIASMIAWSVVNYISLHPIFFAQLFWIRLVLFMATPLCLLVYLTFTVFPAQKIEKETWKINTAIIATFIVMILTLTPLVFKSISYQNGNPTPEPGPGIALFVLLAVGLISAGIWNLVTKFRHSKGHQREQIRFVLLGLAGTFSLIFITNVLLVIIFSNSSFIALGSAYTLIFSSALAYAIVRHKLFDIRRTVTRGFAYIITISFLALIYSILVFGSTSLIFGKDDISSSTQASYTLMALLLAVSFQPIKSSLIKFQIEYFTEMPMIRKMSLIMSIRHL